MPLEDDDELDDDDEDELDDDEASPLDDDDEDELDDDEELDELPPALLAVEDVVLPLASPVAPASTSW